MTPDQAKAALIFLQRVQLTGAEVPTFVEVLAAVEAQVRQGAQNAGRQGGNGTTV